MVSTSYQIPQYGSGGICTLPLPGTGGKSRWLMCSCNLITKNEESPKTEGQTCNNRYLCFDFHSPSIPQVVCVLPPQILQNSSSAQPQGNKVERKGKVEQKRMSTHRKDAQWEGLPYKRTILTNHLEDVNWMHRNTPPRKRIVQVLFPLTYCSNMISLVC